MSCQAVSKSAMNSEPPASGVAGEEVADSPVPDSSAQEGAWARAGGARGFAASPRTPDARRRFRQRNREAIDQPTA